MYENHKYHQWNNINVTIEHYFWQAPVITARLNRASHDHDTWYVYHNYITEVVSIYKDAVLPVYGLVFNTQKCMHPICSFCRTFFHVIHTIIFVSTHKKVAVCYHENVCILISWNIGDLAPFSIDPWQMWVIAVSSSSVAALRLWVIAVYVTFLDPELLMWTGGQGYIARERCCITSVDIFITSVI